MNEAGPKGSKTTLNATPLLRVGLQVWAQKAQTSNVIPLQRHSGRPWAPKGSPKLLRNATGDTPRSSKTPPWHHVATRATADARKARKMTPQRLPNQVFFGACGARCLILSMFFWKTANMQSAHACALQTAFQAPPTRPRMTIKHNLRNTKTQTVSRIDFECFCTSKVDPTNL